MISKKPGRPAAKEKKQRVTITLDPEIIAKAKELVSGTDGLSTLINELLWKAYRTQVFRDECGGPESLPEFENARLFLLKPAGSGGLDLQTGALKNAILVRARDERQARQFAAIQTGKMMRLPATKEAVCQSPWQNAERVLSTDVTGAIAGESGIGVPGIVKFLETKKSGNSPRKRDATHSR